TTRLTGTRTFILVTPKNGAQTMIRTAPCQRACRIAAQEVQYFSFRKPTRTSSLFRRRVHKYLRFQRQARLCHASLQESGFCLTGERQHPGELSAWRPDDRIITRRRPAA